MGIGWPSGERYIISLKYGTYGVSIARMHSGLDFIHWGCGLRVTLIWQALRLGLDSREIRGSLLHTID